MIEPGLLDALDKCARDGTPEWRDGPTRALVRTLIGDYRRTNCWTLAAALGRALDSNSYEFWSVVDELNDSFPGFAWSDAMTDGQP